MNDTQNEVEKGTKKNFVSTEVNTKIIITKNTQNFRQFFPDQNEPK